MLGDARLMPNIVFASLLCIFQYYFIAQPATVASSSILSDELAVTFRSRRLTAVQIGNLPTFNEGQNLELRYRY